MNNPSVFNVYEFRIMRNAYPNDTHYFYQRICCVDPLDLALFHCMNITHISPDEGGIGILTPFSYE